MVCEKVSDLFEQAYVQEYKHWETGDPLIDLDHEIEILEKETSRMGIVEEVWLHTDPSNPSNEEDNHRLADDFGRK